MTERVTALKFDVEGWDLTLPNGSVRHIYDDVLILHEDDLVGVGAADLRRVHTTLVAGELCFVRQAFRGSLGTAGTPGQRNATGAADAPLGGRGTAKEAGCLMTHAIVS